MSAPPDEFLLFHAELSGRDGCCASGYRSSGGGLGPLPKSDEEMNLGWRPSPCTATLLPTQSPPNSHLDRRVAVRVRPMKFKWLGRTEWRLSHETGLSSMMGLGRMNQEGMTKINCPGLPGSGDLGATHNCSQGRSQLP